MNNSKSNQTNTQYRYKYTTAPSQVQQKQQPKKVEGKAKKGIKKLCFYLATFMILGTIKQAPFTLKGKVTEIANKNASHNYMDDVFASDETIEVLNPETGKTQEIQLEEAVDKLEDFVEICTLINNLNIDESSYIELTEQEMQNVINLYNEKGIEGVISIYKQSKGNNIERARAARQLIFIKNYFGGSWLDKNGLNISKALLTKTIQTGAIESYGTFSPLEYSAASIPTENEYPYFNVTLHDQVSGASDDIFFTPVICGEYAESMLYLRKLNELNEEALSSKEKLDYTKNALRLVKKCLNKEVNNFYGVTYTKKAK